MCVCVCVCVCVCAYFYCFLFISNKDGRIFISENYEFLITYYYLI